MAAQPFTTTRRTLLGAAAALPIAALPASLMERATTQSSPAANVWNRRLARYRDLLARERSEGERLLAAAYLRHGRDVEKLQRRFGSWDAARPTEEGRPICDAISERLATAENAYYDDFTAPTQRAGVRLALTPAPDLSALLSKIRVMHEHELDELESMTRPALEALAEDVEGLLAAAT